MKNEKLVQKIIDASNYIAKNGRRGKADHIFVSDDYIQRLADERGLSFDEMVKILEDATKPKDNSEM